MKTLDNTVSLKIEECYKCPFYHTLDGYYYTEWCFHPQLYHENFKIFNSENHMTIKLPESCPLISNPVTIYRKE